RRHWRDRGQLRVAEQAAGVLRGAAPVVQPGEGVRVTHPRCPASVVTPCPPLPSGERERRTGCVSPLPKGEGIKGVRTTERGDQRGEDYEDYRESREVGLQPRPDPRRERPQRGHMPLVRVPHPVP